MSIELLIELPYAKGESRKLIPELESLVAARGGKLDVHRIDGDAEPTLAVSSSEGLIRAIRAFTVDAPNDEPNGAAEAALSKLGEALRSCDRNRALNAYEAYCAAAADDTGNLRKAAEGYFGVSFRHPASGDAR
jgi:hypothetical protein